MSTMCRLRRVCRGGGGAVARSRKDEQGGSAGDGPVIGPRSNSITEPGNGNLSERDGSSASRRAGGNNERCRRAQGRVVEKLLMGERAHGEAIRPAASAFHTATASMLVGQA